MQQHVADADRKIVFDKFHIAQHLGDAVDRVRRKENKTLRADGWTRWLIQGWNCWNVAVCFKR